MYCWCRLYVGCKDLCLLPQIKGEGIAGPVTLHLHHLERYAPQQIFERGPDSDAVALQQL